VNSVLYIVMVYGIHGWSVYFALICRYRHLMLNLVSLMPHCKKDNKVESKETKGATLNELVELKSCSSCLFFEVFYLYATTQSFFSAVLLQ